MFFFRKKSRSFSLTDLLGFEFKKIGFESIFPFESYATTSLAVATCQQQLSKLVLLNDNQGSNDPVFNDLLRIKLANLQQAIQQQNPALEVVASLNDDSPTDDDFIHLNSNTQMSDVLDFVFQSHVRQRRPILVNMEHSPLLSDKPSRLSALIVRDAYFHVNFLSLLGDHSEVAKRITHRLLYSGRVAYLGFKMNDFAILGRNKRVTLDEPIVALLADQSKQRVRDTILIDDVPS